MKILLDEMYSGLREYFEVLGWDVVTVQEAGLRGAKDLKVAEWNDGVGWEYFIIDQVGDVGRMTRIIVSHGRDPRLGHEQFGKFIVGNQLTRLNAGEF